MTRINDAGEANRLCALRNVFVASNHPSSRASAERGRCCFAAFTGPGAVVELPGALRATPENLLPIVRKVAGYRQAAQSELQEEKQRWVRARDEALASCEDRGYDSPN